MKRTKSAGQELFELLYSKADPLPLACLRIVFGGILLVRLLLLCLQFGPLFTPDSPISLDLSRLFVESPSLDSVPYLHWDLFAISPGTTWAATIFAIYGLAIVCFILGWQTRLAAFVMFVCTVSIHRREPFIWTRGDYLAQVMCFWLLFVPAGAALSLDAARRHCRGAAEPVVRNWHLGLLQAQLALVYLSTGLLKLGTSSWKEGDALAGAWQVTYYARPWSSHLAQIPGLSALGTWATLVFELAFPLFIWNRRMRPWLLSAGVLFHLGIDLTLRAGPFSAVMLACYIPFLPAAALRRCERWATRVRNRVEFQFWQLAVLRKGKWVVYYNGDCGFCRRWVVRAKRITLPQVAWRDFQQHGAEVAHLHPRFDQAAYLVIDGTVALPAFRAFRKLLVAMPPLWPLIPLCYLPGAASIGDAVYRYISIRYGPVDKPVSCHIP